MAETLIEWADYTFNPWIGCAEVGPGCDHCYARRMAMTYGWPSWGTDQPRKRTTPSNWEKPLVWSRKAARLGVRYRVFAGSLCDIFDNAVPTEWLADLMQLIRQTPNLYWLLLTKRVGNVVKRLSPADLELMAERVWLGISVCNQTEAYRDIPVLTRTPAFLRFLSMEPLLEPVVLPDLPVDWIITGGESGPHARPSHPDWFRSLRDQCQAQGTAFFFKQHGEWIAQDLLPRELMQAVRIKRYTYLTAAGAVQDTPGADTETLCWVGKKKAGALLDGRIEHAYPLEVIA